MSLEGKKDNWKLQTLETVCEMFIHSTDFPDHLHGMKIVAQINLPLVRHVATRKTQQVSITSPG